MTTTPLFKTSMTLPLADATAASAALCPSNLPLVLLPVRLETRFFKLATGVTELRVRIYPDKIHVDSHDPDLTTEERTLGQDYWRRDWAAAADVAARGDAWRNLANRFGAARAAWIARMLRPTNIAQRPTGEPVFPSLPPVGQGGELAWRRTPQARLLPDRWTAVLHSGGAVALTGTSLPVRRPLAVGPDPRAPKLTPAEEAAVKAGDQLPIDPGMRWMIDFAEAEAAGMALRMAVPATVLGAGIDSLVVFGVSRAATPADTAGLFADLLDAHAYTDGLEFLPLGAPTNNTDSRRAAYHPEDPDHARSFQAEVLNDPATAANAARLGAALGLARERSRLTLGHLSQAHGDHGADAQSMNTALWPVGWGYFLTNMVGAETGLTAAALKWAREHFVTHVRAAGMFPTLRVGAQPYGILPVTSLDGWTPADTAEVRVKDLLKKLRDKVWRNALPQVARIGRRSPANPDADLAEVMTMDGVSHGLAARRLLGRQYLQHLFAIGAQTMPTGAPDVNGNLVTPTEVADRLLDKLGLPKTAAVRPRVSGAFFEALTRAIRAPLVQAGEVSPTQALSPNYITNLLATGSIAAVAGQALNSSLLEALLRHGLLREIATAAARIHAASRPEDLPALLRDLELVDMVDSARENFIVRHPVSNSHWRRQLDRAQATVTGTKTVRQHLEGLQDFSHETVASLGEFRAALGHLQGLDTQRLQFLMQSTLDLSSHRLDAWITSLANKRLKSMTDTGAVGQYVGGYGWVENLRPAARTPLPDTALPAGEPGPLFTPSNDTGFIHAPSVTHASAAALLRNAHLGPGGRPTPDDPFAIDLSSRRVREANRLLEGVRSGQPLGALLGYRLERRLQDAGRSRLIAPLREAAPIAVRAREDAAAARNDAVAAANVVDGLVLANLWKEKGASWLAEVLRSCTAEDQAAARAEVLSLLDDLDGLSDALTAEIAYQLARGNTSRLGSTLGAVARGDAPPPELEVARTPRTGSSMTHRVVVVIDAAYPASSAWPATSPAAAADRRLNAWVASSLGDPRKIRCTVEQLERETGAVVATAAFPLSELGLAPLDVLYAVDEAAGGASGGLTHLEQLVLYNARRRPGGFGPGSDLRLAHERPANLASGELTLFDAQEYVRAMRRLLESARAMGPDDLTVPERQGRGAIDLAELEARVRAGEAALTALHARMQNSVATRATTADALRADLIAMGAFGVRPTVPVAPVGDTPEIREDLLRQTAAALLASGPRLAQVVAARAAPPAADARQRCAQLLEQGRAVFGSKFVMLPVFTMEVAEEAELKKALSGGMIALGPDPLAINRWLVRSAEVREPLSRFLACTRMEAALRPPRGLASKLAQLPFVLGERWVGLPPLAGTELPPGKLSLIAHSPTWNDGTPIAGLFIDEWVEVAPSASETTAITFQFDPPDSVAPQAVLIAVPPTPGQDWTTESLRAVLMETLDLAKLRAVEPGLLGAAAQYLPGLYMAFNAAGDAVSTDFTPLTR